MGKAALLIAIGAALIGGAVALAILGRGGPEGFEAFRDRSLDYVAAFAEAAAGWLAEGDRKTLEDAARFMLLGSAALVEVVWKGEEVVREGRGDLSPPELAAPPSGTQAVPVGGGEFLEVFYPLDEEGDYVRVWLEVPFRGGGIPWAPVVTGALAFLGTGALGGGVYLARFKRSPATGGTNALIEVGSLVIDEGSKEVRLCGKPVKLSPKQYALLVLLAREPGRVFSDREILRELWPDSRYANSKDVKQYVYLLRRRLGKVMPGAEALIATVPGFGYKLLSPEEIGLTGR